MDYRKIINWFVSPLPPVFTVDSSGNKIEQSNPIAAGASKLFLFLKIIIILIVVFGIFKIINFFKN
jgi:hypothetical protein